MGVYVSFSARKFTAVRLSHYIQETLGFPVTREEFHVTTVYSREPFVYTPIKELHSVGPPYLAVPDGLMLLRGRRYSGLCLVLTLLSEAIETSHKKAREAGASWDFPQFIPHVTLVYGLEEKDLIGRPLIPPSFTLLFEEETIQDLDMDWKPTEQDLGKS